MARPCKPLGEQHLNRVCILLTDDQYNALTARSQRTGVQVAVLARHDVVTNTDEHEQIKHGLLFSMKNNVVNRH